MSGKLTVLCRTIADFRSPQSTEAPLLDPPRESGPRGVAWRRSPKASICGRPTVLPSAYPYCERMTQVGADCRLAPYEDAGHGFFKRDPYYEQTLHELVQFLERQGWLEER